jgi:hypothetical protein
MEGWTALHVAVAGRKFDSCQFPLRHDAEVGATGHIGLTQLHLAAAYGHIGVVKLLLWYVSDPEIHNNHGFNTVFEVLHSQFIESPAAKEAIVRWIFQQDYFPVNVNDRDYFENLALTWHQLSRACLL